MAAAVQPVLSGSLSERIETPLQRTRAILQASRGLVAASRELCETSSTLIEKNASLQEFLRDNILNVWSRCEHRLDQVSGPPYWLPNISGWKCSVRVPNFAV